MLLLLLACRAATPVDWCVENPGECATCEADADCVWAGNPCTESVYCIEEGADLAVVMIGCEEIAEYSWPDASECGCVAGVCQQK